MLSKYYMHKCSSMTIYVHTSPLTHTIHPPFASHSLSTATTIFHFILIINQTKPGVCGALHCTIRTRSTSFFCCFKKPCCISTSCLHSSPADNQITTLTKNASPTQLHPSSSFYSSDFKSVWTLVIILIIITKNRVTTQFTLLLSMKMSNNNSIYYAISSSLLQHPYIFLLTKYVYYTANYNYLFALH